MHFRSTGRRPDEVLKAVGESEQLLVVRLDVTNVEDADASVDAAVERFGRIDVLVNSAGASFKGYFEEMSPEQVEQQQATRDRSVDMRAPVGARRSTMGSLTPTPGRRRSRSGARAF